MEIKEGSKLKGTLIIDHYDKDGKLKAHNVYNNLIVNSGIALLAALCAGTATTPIIAMAVGTGTVAAASTDTALQTEVMRGATTNTIATTTITNDTGVYVTTFSFTATYAITEEGLFTSTTASSGIMLSHRVFSAYNVVSGDTLAITHKIQSLA